MVSQNTLETLADEARERRLSGSHYDSGELPLTGYCFDNALVVYELLVENGYSPTIIAGLSEGYAESLLREVPIEDLDTVEDLAGQVHYWVECDGYIIDIAPMLEVSYGEPYVDDSLPESYHKLSDSEQYAEETLESGRVRRCSYCGGRDGYCGCEYES